MPNAIDARTPSWAAVVIITLVTASLPFGLAHQYILYVVAIAALIILISDTIRRKPQAGNSWLIILFCLIWIPMLVSTFWAMDVERSASAVARYASYGLAGYLLLRLTNPKDTPILLYILGGLILLLCLDGILQFITNTNLMGFQPHSGRRLTGVFNDSPRLGMVVAILSPLYIEMLRQMAKRHILAWLGLVPLVIVIALGGSRSSWMIFAFIAIAYPAILYLSGVRHQLKPLIITFLIAMVATSLTLAKVDWLNERAKTLTNIATLDYELTNRALSGRLPLWQAALAMYKDNPTLGIGVRGFGDAYYLYEQTGSRWSETSPPGHPHLAALEVASETGTLGLTSYSLFLLLLGVLFFRLDSTAREMAAPWFLSTQAAAFPLASTVPFYGAFLSTLIWIPLVVFLAIAGFHAKKHRPAKHDDNAPA